MNFLSNVEFAINNHENIFTKLILFFVKHDYYSKNEAKFSNDYNKFQTQKTKFLKTNKIIALQQTLHSFLKKKIDIDTK